MTACQLKNYTPLLFSFFFFCYCSNENSNKGTSASIDADMHYADSITKDVSNKLITADLVLRAGRDFSSEQVKELSPDDKTYSHGGIVVKEEGSIYVYHVEPDYYYQNDKVRKEPLDSFIDPRHNTGFALARYQLDSIEKKELIAFLEEKYQQRIPFDMSFDLNSDDKMYCSEMIKKGLDVASKGKIRIEPIPLSDRSKFKQIKQYFKLEEKQFVYRPIIPIDRLFLHPACTIIERYEYLR